MLEKEIEAEILDYLEAEGLYCWKNATVGYFDPKRKVFRKPSSRHQIKGTADILGILPNGRFLAIEVKSKRGIVRPEQRKFLESIANHGGLALIARSLQEVKDVVHLLMADYNESH